MLFKDLGLSAELLRAIEEQGYSEATPIQQQAIPFVLEGRDILAGAQTGTGKTAAFMLPSIDRLRESDNNIPFKSCRMLVLAPTRELAEQTAKATRVLARATKLRTVTVYGGVSKRGQVDKLRRGAEIVVACPGRLLDLLGQRALRLDRIEVLVLDEADRMFDMGFIKDIRYLLRRLPPPDKRLNMLFSATLSHNVMELAYEHMNEPELIRIEPDKVTADKVRQAIFFPSNAEKMPLLVGLIREMGQARIMVFVNMKREAERVQAYLQANGIDAQAISGDVPQKKRLRMLMDFQSGVLPVLIGTDVASRGLHIPDVQYVINYDLPQDAEDYVHRIGRTARAGAAGDAISFGCETYAMSLPDIEDYIGHKIPVANYDVSLLPELVKPKYSARDRGRKGSNRGSKKGPSRRKRPPRKS